MIYSFLVGNTLLNHNLVAQKGVLLNFFPPNRKRVLMMIKGSICFLNNVCVLLFLITNGRLYLTREETGEEIFLLFMGYFDFNYQDNNFEEDILLPSTSKI